MMMISQSAAWLNSSERRCNDDHDRKVDVLTSTLTSLLRPGKLLGGI